MRKIICICLAGAVLAGLCACGKTPASTELTTVQTSSGTAESAEALPAETTVIESSSIYGTGEIPVTYSGKTSDEVFGIIQEIRHISSGSLFDDYLKRFSVYPDTENLSLIKNLSWHYEPEEYDSIRQISLFVTGDGEDVAENVSSAEIILWFDDKSVASGVYHKVVKLLTDENGIPDSDKRDGNSWQTFFGDCSVSMLEADGIHQLTIVIKTVPV